ncbi:MAG: lipopolysaccharide biosynthesis protein [Verrucomicrobiales bacterium]|nr:lipopolysaccharide biosynthesis protein [Verrucomicrobiales bacterium]
MADQEKRNVRNRSIRQAVSTSLISKGTTAILQFVSLPVAARALGREEFGVYATISMSVFMVAMLQIGVGPALARGISEAAAKDDHRRQARLYINGFFLVVILALLGFLLTAILITTFPVTSIFGAEYAPFVEQMKPALWVGLFLVIADIVVAKTDRVREGYMEAGVVNAFAAAGNFTGAILVFVGVQYLPSVSYLLIAVFAPNIVARIFSTLFLLKKRPWLIQYGFKPSPKLMGELVRDGVSFSATSVMVYIVEYAVCALIIGRVTGPGDVAVFQIFMALTTAFTGMLVMVGRPFWAAIVDAKTRGDQEWMNTASRRYYQYLGLLFTCAAIGLISIGPWILPKLYGEEFVATRLLFVCHAIFLALIGWREVNRYLSIGLGLLPKAVLPILSGLLVGLLIGVIGLKEWGLAALFIGLALGNFIPGFLLPRLVRAEFNRASAPAPTAPVVPAPKISVRP